MTKSSNLRSYLLHSRLAFLCVTLSGVALAQPAGPEGPTDTSVAEVAPQEEPAGLTEGAAAKEATVPPSAAAPAAGQPANQPSPKGEGVAVTEPVEQKPEPASGKPNPAPALATGDGGGLKLSGVVQVWGVFQHQEDIAAPRDNASTARLRRAELKVSGDLVPKKFSFGVMIDAAKTPRFGSTTVVTPPEEGETETGTASVMTPARDNSLLQDATITYSGTWFDVTAGQFKTPISYESATSSSKLLLPERAAVVRAYGEQRDVGIKLEKKLEYVGFVVGAFNGAGLNRIDDNMQKDVALRLEAYPTKTLTIAGVGYTSVGQRASQASTKDRLEVDLALDVGALHVQGEYIHGWNGPSGERLEGHGWYGALGYTIGKVIQPVVRVGQLDLDLDTEDDAATTVEGGINAFVLKDTVKLQLAYAHTGYEASGVDALHEVVLAGQFKY